MNPLLGWLLKLVGLAVAATGIFIAHKKFNFNDNEVIEKVVEEEIKEETGVTVDLEDAGEGPSK